MKNLFKAIMAVAAAGAAVVAGKLCYDFFVKKNGEMNDDFFDDLEDDFSEVIFEDEFFSFDTEPEKDTETKSESVKVVKVNPAKPASDKEAEAKNEEPKKETKKEEPKKAAPKATVKKPVAKKTNAKKANTKKAQSLTCQDVIDCTSNVLGVSAEDILSKSRKADVANARRVAIYVCSTELKVTNATICEEFGGIGATSVTNAKKNISDKIKEDPDTKADIEDIVDELKRLEESFNKK